MKPLNEEAAILAAAEQPEASLWMVYYMLLCVEKELITAQQCVDALRARFNSGSW